MVLCASLTLTFEAALRTRDARISVPGMSKLDMSPGVDRPVLVASGNAAMNEVCSAAAATATVNSVRMAARRVPRRLRSGVRRQVVGAACPRAPPASSSPAQRVPDARVDQLHFNQELRPTYKLGTGA